MEVELKSAEDVELELKNFFLGEFVLGHVKKILQFGWVDLFVLGRNEEGCDTEDVELSLFYLDL
jgi:hypothetical protein